METEKGRTPRDAAADKGFNCDSCRQLHDDLRRSIGNHQTIENRIVFFIEECFGGDITTKL